MRYPVIDGSSYSVLTHEENILAFYEPPAAPIFDKKKPDHRNRTLRNIEQLRSLQLEKETSPAEGR